MSFILQVVSLKCIKAGADPYPGDADDTYIKVNGQKIWSHDFNTNDFFQVSHNPVHFAYNTQIELWDDDTWPNPDDRMGSIIVTGNPNAPVGEPVFNEITLSGSGSQYLLSYQITNI
jgi:hypothetical protein